MNPKGRKDDVQKKGESGFSALQRGLTGERALVGESYMDNPEMLRAYLDYYGPVSRAQARYALQSAALFSGKGEFGKVIDVGSGPGPLAAALIERGASEVVLVDQSRRALDLAVRTLPGTVSISTVVSDISKPDTSGIPMWGIADCVSFGHCLNELWADREDRVFLRARLLEKYAEALVPGGILLVIEPALLVTSRDLLAVRNELVSRGWRILAPCPGRAALPCPALEAGMTHTCHEEIKWKMPAAAATLAKSLKLDKDSLKMTWFAFAPPSSVAFFVEASCCAVPVSFTGKTREVLDLSGGVITENSPIYRVVSDPMLNKAGRVRRLVCGATGRFPLSAPEGSAVATESGFNLLERGDFIRVEHPALRENGWGVAPDTVITQIDRTGKI